MKPLLLSPCYVKTIWGSNRISQIRHMNEKIGSWWEVSAHSNAQSTVINLEDKPTLLEVIQENPDDILGPGYTLHEMLRTAFLDTDDHLSIQVHPDDAYALKHSNDFGKYESWYIVYAEKDAYLVAGTKTNQKEIIQNALKEENLEPYLKKWKVKAGDYITIPNGTLHALGKGILAYEIGTNSDTTYRFYDYNRTDDKGNKRELHLKESFDVCDFSSQPIFVPAQNISHNLSSTPYFQVDELYTEKEETISCKEHYCILTNLTKENLSFQWNGQTMILDGYGSLFVPYSAQEIKIPSGCHVLLSIPKKGKKQ